MPCRLISQYLTRLSEQDMIERDRRKVERRIKAAKFPVVKSLDFAAIPKLNKMQGLELARCEWIERRLIRLQKQMAALPASHYR